MHPEDREYFQRRAKEERERAMQSEEKVISAPHLRMAEEYERRAKGMTPITHMAREQALSH